MIERVGNDDNDSLQSHQIPQLYLLNAASLAKPHAIENLYAKLTFLSVAAALVTESHLRMHHADETFTVVGYNLTGPDRTGRRGGGAVIHLKDGILFSMLKLIHGVPE